MSQISHESYVSPVPEAAIGGTLALVRMAMKQVGYFLEAISAEGVGRGRGPAADYKGRAPKLHYDKG